jgi:hypothetical protein
VLKSRLERKCPERSKTQHRMIASRVQPRPSPVPVAAVAKEEADDSEDKSSSGRDASDDNNGGAGTGINNEQFTGRHPWVGTESQDEGEEAQR